MNWYNLYKVSQVVDYKALVNSIYQRLVQSSQGATSGENAADDIHSQGFDPTTIEQAIQQAVYQVVGDQGEQMLTDGQRHVIQTIRGGQMMGGESPVNQPMGEGQGINLNSV